MILRSPLSYQGSKYKLMRSILAELPEHRVFHDVFGGSGTVSLNVGSSVVNYNDWDIAAYSVLRCLKNAPDPQRIIDRLDYLLDKYDLDRENDPAYYRFRGLYNHRPKAFWLWVLSKHSFSSLMRFNKQGLFNLPFGFRTIEKTASRDRWINEFWTRLQNINLHNSSYLGYVQQALIKAGSDDLFYFDPPYLASGDNVYKGRWTVANENKLLSLLNYLDSQGIRWMLSNVVRHRQHHNKILETWMQDYQVVYPAFSTRGEGYSLHRAAAGGPNKTVEVLVKNF